MIRVNTRPRKRNAPRPAEKAAPGFLQWLRGRDCLFEGHGPCSGKMEAMHVDYAGGKGVATKVADRFAVPGCSTHHGRQHQIGWAAFEAECLMAPGAALLFAEGYWKHWPGRIAWERKLEDRP